MSSRLATNSRTDRRPPSLHGCYENDAGLDVNECHVFLSGLSKELESRTHILVKLHSQTLHGRPRDPSILCLADARGQFGQEMPWCDLITFYPEPS